MEMPKPSAAHAKLHQLAGSWTGDETLHPSAFSPEARSAHGVFHMRMAVDGMFLVSDYEESRDGEVVFRGHGVYGYDAKRERYTMFWFDSMGISPSEVLGTWDGDTLTFEASSEHGKARYIYQVKDGGGMRFSITGSHDGEQWSCIMEGDYERAD